MQDAGGGEEKAEGSISISRCLLLLLLLLLPLLPPKSPPPPPITRDQASHKKTAQLLFVVEIPPDAGLNGR